jgi:hypothetical protein
MTSMQSIIRCKRASMPSEPFNRDSIIESRVTHHGVICTFPRVVVGGLSAKF